MINLSTDTPTVPPTGTPTAAPTAALLIIGNEILSGRTADVNLNAVAKKLVKIGVKLLQVRVIADDEKAIISAIESLCKSHTYLITTGGIGPTHDDITAASVAKAFARPLILHPEARARLLAYYTESKLTEARLRMARVPEGASLIDNPVSAAPGFRIENVFVLAGVPNIMQAMMDHVVTQLQHGPNIHSVSISGKIGESVIANELAEIAALYPQLDIGSYPWFREGLYGTSLVTRGTDETAVNEAGSKIFLMIEKANGKPEIEATPLLAE